MQQPCVVVVVAAVDADAVDTAAAVAVAAGALGLAGTVSDIPASVEANGLAAVAGHDSL